MKRESRPSRVVTVTLCIASAIIACEPEGEAPPAKWRDAPVDPPTPEIPGSLADAELPPVVDRISGDPLTPNFIKSPEKAVALGKALFWDMQAGSDGQACASCHFSAGADNRARNQVSPGLLAGDEVFDPTRSGAIAGPNYTLVADDYPFHEKLDPTDRDSATVFDTNDVTSSAGVAGATFMAVTSGALADLCAAAPDPIFSIDAINLRRVEPRNTPTVINAIFNYRNFWDGRANNLFNGVDPFGPRSQAAFIVEVQGGKAVKRQVLFTNSSPASQAVGPILSDFEMSCANRAFGDVAAKLVRAPTVPLARQQVHPDDSVLGAYADTISGVGLNTTYQALIEEAFADRLWDSTLRFDTSKKVIKNLNKVPSDQQLSLMEVNFSLFWGLSIQMYEQTLVSKSSPFDRYREGELDALSPAQLAGLEVFMGDGKCINCHDTAMFTKASTLHLIPEAEEGGLVERMLMSEEHQHYAVRTRKAIGLAAGLGGKGKKSTALSLTLEVEGTPTLVGGVTVPGPAEGTITLTKKGGGCTYAATSLTFGADGGPSRDALIEATWSEGDGCPATLVVHVEDDSQMGMKWVDVVRIDDGGGGFVHSATTSASDLEIRQPALYDNGFYNIGVRPTADDIGVGGVDPFGNPLSFTEQFVQRLQGLDPPDPFEVDPCSFAVPWLVALDGVLFPGGFTDLTTCDGLLSALTGVPADHPANQRFLADLRTATAGAFKTPSLRNVEATAPYMHNGGMSTLEQVVEFYNRGGNFPRNPELDPDITRLNLSPTQQQDLVAFLRSLTDPDVVFERAPFDHPQLFVSKGLDVVEDVDPADGRADEDLFTVGLEVEAIGKDGRAPDDPIRTFLDLASFP